jgi:poly-gamma-glutamate capsule biosynthesis protein CapA/YwtB (metallophosphatase superfamily)
MLRRVQGQQTERTKAGHESLGPLVVAGAVAALIAGIIAITSSGDDAHRLASFNAARAGATGSTPVALTSPGLQPASARSADPAPLPAAHAPGNTRPRRVSVVLTGDILLHNTIWDQARRDAVATGQSRFDFRPILGGIRAVVARSDLAICHLETPLAAAGGPYTSYPRFSVPPQITKALAWTGYDGCTTASNHTLDAGETGIRRTLAALDDAKLAHTGSARTTAESHRPMWFTAGEGRPVRIAVLAYTQMLNGLTPPTGKSWIVNTIDPEAILLDARRARKAGADLVFVALHWGIEYQHQPTLDQRRLARRLLMSPDVDLVYGHHAHVVQPFGKVGGKWVAYGLGNCVADQRGMTPGTREGVLARFTFTERLDGGWVSRAEYLPTYITTGRSLRVVDLSRALADRSLTSTTRAVYRRAWRDVTQAVSSTGALKAGLHAIDRDD